MPTVGMIMSSGERVVRWKTGWMIYQRVLFTTAVKSQEKVKDVKSERMLNRLVTIKGHVIEGIV